MVRALLEKKAPIDGETPEGTTALLAALTNGHDEIATMLIEAGADLNRPNSSGLTPLIVAIARENLASSERERLN